MMEAILMTCFSVFLCGISGYVICDYWPIRTIRGRIRTYATLWCGWQLIMTGINMVTAKRLSAESELYDALSIVSFLELLLGCLVLAGLALSSKKLSDLTP